MEKETERLIIPRSSISPNACFRFLGLMIVLFLGVQMPLNAQQWTETNVVTPSDGGLYDGFGEGLAIAGDYAVVGARQHDYDVSGGNYAFNTGAAYVYERINGNWTMVQKLVGTDRDAEDFFGYSVAIDGDYILVGAYLEELDEYSSNSAAYAGAVFVFHRSGGVWTQTQKLVASDRQAYDFFGHSVSISGKYAVVGAYQEDHDAGGSNSLSEAGSAYFFELQQGMMGDSWVQVAKVVASDRSASDYFGYKVAISGNTALIGAPQDWHDASGGNSIVQTGSGYFFERNSSGVWTQTQKIVASERDFNDQFGARVSLSGNYAVLTAMYEDEDENGANYLNSAGAAYTFERSGGTWTQTHKIVAPERREGASFGRSMALSGNYLVFGNEADNFDENGGDSVAHAGAAWIYKRNDAGNWLFNQKIVATNRVEEHTMGQFAAISGYNILLGTTSVSPAGGAYFFNAAPDTLPHGGYTLDFDGTDDIMSAAVISPEAFTIEFWFKNEDPSLTSDDFTLLNFKGEDDYSPWIGISNGKVSLYSSNGNSYHLFSTTSVGTEWMHVAVTYDYYAGGSKLYINGVLEDTQNSLVVTTGGTLLYLGDDSFGYLFTGKIDEVRIWDVVRTQAEIQADMNRELTGTESNLVAYYPMSDSSGNTVTDYSRFGHMGALSNGPTWKASGALAGPDQALDFDGTDDYVSVPHDASLNLGADDFTIEWWVKRSVTGSRMDILNKKADDGSSDLGIFLTDLDKIMFFVEEATVSQTVVSLTSIGTEWTHIAGVRDGNNLSVYINGVLDNTSTASPRNVNNTSHLIFGGNNQGGSVSVNFTGTLDEVRIWTIARTAEEIRANMYHTLRGDEGSLQAYYRFDQQPDAGNLTVYDMTANANHGTLTNMTPASDWVNATSFNTWIGSEDSNWGNADNWSLGSVPTTQDAGIFGWAGSSLPASGNITVRNFYLDAATTFNHSGNLTLSGDFFNAGTFISTGTTTFDGSSSQTIRGTGTTTFGTLLLNKGGVVTLDHNVATSGLTLTSGDLSIGTNTLTVNGALALTSGTLTGGSTSNLVVGGSGASTTLPAIILSGLTLNRANGLALSGTVNVAGILTLSDGILDLNSQVLALGDGATVSGTPNDNRHVDASSGTMRKGYSGAGSFLFPVGDGSLYSPITLNFTSGNFSSAYANVGLTTSKHPNNSSSTDFLSRYWTVSAPGITAFDCEVSAQYADADISGTETNLQGGKWNGVSWLDLGPVSDASNLITATVSSFSDFTAGEPSTFPVEWLSLSATPLNAQVKIEWATATEINSDYFGVESSTDQQLWGEIGTVKAAGNSAQPRDYSFLDTKPSSGRNFYRLKQVDVNGNFSYSAQVEALISDQKFRAYPTPVTDVLQLELGTAAYEVSLNDVSGKLIKAWSGMTGNASVSVNEIPTGIYFIRVTALGQTPWQKIIVKL